MHWRKAIGFILLGTGLAASAASAARAVLADATEERDTAGVRRLLAEGADVNAAMAEAELCAIDILSW